MPKSIIIKKNGGPEVLELQDVSVSTPGPDEIKVTNRAIGLNYIDTYHRSGLYPLKLPTGIGAEGAGIITEIGSSIKDFKGISGRKGSFQQKFRVYDRESLKCKKMGCKGIIKKIYISRRSSFYCSVCQNN